MTDPTKDSGGNIFLSAVIPVFILGCIAFFIFIYNQIDKSENQHGSVATHLSVTVFEGGDAISQKFIVLKKNNPEVITAPVHVGDHKKIVTLGYIKLMAAGPVLSLIPDARNKDISPDQLKSIQTIDMEYEGDSATIGTEGLVITIRPALRNAEVKV